MLVWFHIVITYFKIVLSTSWQRIRFKSFQRHTLFVTRMPDYFSNIWITKIRKRRYEFVCPKDAGEAAAYLIYDRRYIWNTVIWQYYIKYVRCSVKHARLFALAGTKKRLRITATLINPSACTTNVYREYSANRCSDESCLRPHGELGNTWLPNNGLKKIKLTSKLVN